MPKRLPANNRPWPENLLYDFGLPAITPTDAEAFISTLPTTERNKSFLRLRYREGKTYNEIADDYKLTSAGVRFAVKTMWEKYGRSPTAPPATPAQPTVTAVNDVAPQSAARQPSTAAAQQTIAPPPVENAVPTAKNEQSAAARPLPLNLAAVRRSLRLTAEEFARPISIENGEALITRLETGFSKPSEEVLQLICDAWGVSRSYLLTGRGEMFDPSPDYCGSLTTLLKKYLAVATFDRKGRQYWKGSLVDDLGRLINVQKLSG